VLLVHAVQGCGDLWTDVATGLADRDFLCVAPDLRGHGRSPRADDYRVSAHVDDLLTVLTSLGISSAHVVGHSLGATVAWTLAARRPSLVGRLVIEDQHPDADPAATASFERWAAEWPWRPASREHALTYLRTHGRSPAWWEPSLTPRSDRGWGWAFDRAAVVESVRDATRRSRWHELARVRAPTLVIRGSASEHVSAETAAKMVQALPDGRLASLSGGHWVHRRPKPYVSAVAEFLR
jgi:pimeloyl-ACP methyl ester carboxylesterase